MARGKSTTKTGSNAKPGPKSKKAKDEAPIIAPEVDALIQNVRRSSRKKPGKNDDTSNKTAPGRGLERNGADDYGPHKHWHYVPIPEDEPDDNGPVPTEDLPRSPGRPRKTFTPPPAPSPSPPGSPAADNAKAPPVLPLDVPAPPAPAAQSRAPRAPSAAAPTAPPMYPPGLEPHNALPTAPPTYPPGLEPHAPSAVPLNAPLHAPPVPLNAPLHAPPAVPLAVPLNAPPAVPLDAPPAYPPGLEPRAPPPAAQPAAPPRAAPPAPPPGDKGKDKQPLFLGDPDDQSTEPPPHEPSISSEEEKAQQERDCQELADSLQELSDHFSSEAQRERELAAERAANAPDGGEPLPDDEFLPDGDGDDVVENDDDDEGNDDKAAVDDDDAMDVDGPACDGAESKDAAPQLKSKPGRVSKKDRKRIDDLVDAFKTAVKKLSVELRKPERVIWALTGLGEILGRGPNLYNLFVRRWCLQNPPNDGEKFAEYVRRFVAAYREHVGPLNDAEREELRAKLIKWLALYDKEVAKEVVTRGEVYRAMLKMKVQFLEIGERNRLLYNIVSFGGIACGVPGDLKGQAANCFWSAGADLEKIVTENEVELRRVLGYVGAWSIAKGAAQDAIEDKPVTEASAKKVDQNTVRKVVAPLVADWEKAELKTSGTNVDWVDAGPQCLKLKVRITDWPNELDIIERDRHLVWNTRMARAAYLFFDRVARGDPDVKRPRAVPLTKLEIASEHSQIDGDYEMWLATPLWKNVDGDVLLTVAEVLEGDPKQLEDKKNARRIRRTADAARAARTRAISKRDPPLKSRTGPKPVDASANPPKAGNARDVDDADVDSDCEDDNAAKAGNARNKKKQAAKKRDAQRSSKKRSAGSDDNGNSDSDGDRPVKKKAKTKSKKSTKRAASPVEPELSSSSSSSSSETPAHTSGGDSSASASADSDADSDSDGGTGSDSDGTEVFIKKPKDKHKSHRQRGDSERRDGARDARRRPHARKGKTQLGGGLQAEMFNPNHRFGSVPPQAGLGVAVAHHSLRGQSPMPQAAAFAGQQASQPPPPPPPLSGPSGVNRPLSHGPLASQPVDTSGMQPHVAQAQLYAAHSPQMQGLPDFLAHQTLAHQTLAPGASRLRARQELQAQMQRIKQELDEFDNTVMPPQASNVAGSSAVYGAQSLHQVALHGHQHQHVQRGLPQQGYGYGASLDHNSGVGQYTVAGGNGNPGGGGQDLDWMNNGAWDASNGGPNM